MVAILRRPEGLFELSIVRVEPFTAPGVEAPLDAGEVYRERIEPLEFAAHDFAGPELKLALARVRRGEDNPETLAAILDLLIWTVPEPGVWPRSMVLPRFDEADTAPRRTAAHPRGFRGTKAQPPKPRSLGVVDLLAFLDGGRHEAMLLQRLARHRDRALALSRYAKLLGPLGRPHGQWFSAEIAARVMAMPAEFRRLFCHAIRGAPRACAELIAAYWTLELDRDPRLRRAIAKLCEYPAFGLHRRWIAALAQVASHRRAVFVELLIETGVSDFDVEDPGVLVAQMEALCDDRYQRHRLHRLLVAVARRRSPAPLLEGFELANEFQPDSCFDHVGLGVGQATLAGIRRVMPVVLARDGPASTMNLAMRLWKQGGSLEGVGALLEAIDWEALDPATACELALLPSVVLACARSDEAIAAKWAVLRVHMPDFSRMLAGLEPSRRAKAICHIQTIVWGWDEPDRLDCACRRYLEILPRSCGPSSTEACPGLITLRYLCSGAEPSWPRIREAPDAAYARLERETARSNDDSLIGDGLASLSSRVPELVAQAFVECTAALLTTAKTLGCIHADAALALLRQLMQTALFEAQVEELAPAELIRLIDATEDPASRSLIPRRLRAQVEGRASLTAEQVERATARVRAGWPRVLLARIDAAVLEELARTLGMTKAPGSAAQRHALLFQRDAREHRRAVRRVLAAHLADERDTLIQHPVNQRWLASHPAIDGALWTRGVDLRVGGRSLAIQRDPLEVLRLGTHVGTCLGLGGSQAYSAAAIMLDINKQVVECRDAHGVVVARQLLALAEDDQLVCFEVYPRASDETIKAAFFAYDREFAQALGVQLHTPSDDSDDSDDSDWPEVALLLAQGWWYDDPIAVPESDELA